MAQGDEGAPRKSKTYRDFFGMNSQNERYKIGDDEFFWMENIMRVGPRKLHSVPGPTSKLVAFPTGCPPDQPPGNQTLTEATFFNIQKGDGSLSGNSRASWGFVGPGGDIIVLVGDAAQPFTGYPEAYQVLHIHPDGSITLETPIPYEFLTTFQNPYPGHSDEPSYFIFGAPHALAATASFSYFSWTNQTVTFLLKSSGHFTPGTATFGAETGGFRWCKKGDSIYFYLSFTSHNTLAEFNATTGAFVQEAVDALPITITGANNPSNVKDMQATDTLLYCLTTSGDADNPGTGGIDRMKIMVFNRSDLSLNKTISFDYQVNGLPEGFSSTFGMQFQGFYVVSDKLIYLTRNSVIWDGSFKIEIGYYDLQNGYYSFVDRIETALSFVNTFPINFWFDSGFFYAGNEGISGFTVNISKIGPIICQDNPAGGVLISFSDFEIPDVQHRFLISPAGDFLVSPAGDFLVEV